MKGPIGEDSGLSDLLGCPCDHGLLAQCEDQSPAPSQGRTVSEGHRDSMHAQLLASYSCHVDKWKHSEVRACGSENNKEGLAGLSTLGSTSWLCREAPTVVLLDTVLGRDAPGYRSSFHHK